MISPSEKADECRISQKLFGWAWRCPSARHNSLTGMRIIQRFSELTDTEVDNKLQTNQRTPFPYGRNTDESDWNRIAT
jgi:hypothetical protein